jgi:hypothetical protein
MEIFLGVVVSTIVQFVKEKTKIPPLAFVLGLSLVAAVAYSLLSRYGLWESFYQILVTAGAFYALIIRNVQGLLKE